MDWFKGKFTGKPHFLVGKFMVSCRSSMIFPSTHLFFPGFPGRSPGVDGRFGYFLVERDFRTGQALRRWPHCVAEAAPHGGLVVPVDAAAAAWLGEVLGLWGIYVYIYLHAHTHIYIP